MTPLVSVIIPAYNAAPYVGRAIESALGQSLGDLEVVVVDDASTDETCDVVRGVTDPRVRLLRNERNAGAAASRNRATDAATGRWLALLDADDWFAPGRLDRLVEHGRALSADAVTDDVEFVSEDGATSLGSLFVDDGIRVTAPTAVTCDGFLAARLAGVPTGRPAVIQPVFRAAFLREHGLRYAEGLAMSEDFLLYCQALMRGCRMFLVPGPPMYAYRQRQGSSSRLDLTRYLELQVELKRRLLDEPYVRARRGLRKGLTRDMTIARRELHALRMRRAVERRDVRAVTLGIAARPWASVRTLARVVRAAVARRSASRGPKPTA
ncbi:MAG TPA: glycosyltransferase [Humisphaera sp.]